VLDFKALDFSVLSRFFGLAVLSVGLLSFSPTQSHASTQAGASKRCQDLFALEIDKINHLEEKILAEANLHLNRPADERGDLVLVKMIGELIESAINPVSQFLTNRNEYPILLDQSSTNTRAADVLEKLNRDTERLNRWSNAQNGLAQKAARLIPGLKSRRIKVWSERVKADHHEAQAVLEKLRAEFEFLRKSSTLVGQHLKQVQDMQQTTLRLRESLQKQAWNSIEDPLTRLEKQNLQKNVLRHLDEKLTDLSGMLVVLEGLQSRINSSIELGLKLEPQLARMTQLGLSAVAVNGRGDFDLKPKHVESTQKSDVHGRRAAKPSAETELDRVEAALRRKSEADAKKFFEALAQAQESLRPLKAIVEDAYFTSALRVSARVKLFEMGLWPDALSSTEATRGDLLLLVKEIQASEASTPVGLQRELLFKTYSSAYLRKDYFRRFQDHTLGVVLLRMGLLSKFSPYEKVELFGEMMEREDINAFELQILKELLNSDSVTLTQAQEKLIGPDGAKIYRKGPNWAVLEFILKKWPDIGLAYVRDETSYNSARRDGVVTSENLLDSNLNPYKVNDSKPFSSPTVAWSFGRYLLHLKPQSKSGLNALVTVFRNSTDPVFRKNLLEFIVRHPEFHYYAARDLLASEVHRLLSTEDKEATVDEALMSLDLSVQDKLALAIVLGREMPIANLLPQVGNIEPLLRTWAQLAARAEGDGIYALLHNDAYQALLGPYAERQNDDFLVEATRLGNWRNIDQYATRISDPKTHFRISHLERAFRTAIDMNQSGALFTLIKLSKTADPDGHDGRMFSLLLHAIETKRASLVRTIFYRDKYYWFYLPKTKEDKEKLKDRQLQLDLAVEKSASKEVSEALAEIDALMKEEKKSLW